VNYRTAAERDTTLRHDGVCPGRLVISEYGEGPGHRNVRRWLRATATIEIDATAPLDQVVRQLEALT
jgi:hypothetical protein